MHYSTFSSSSKHPFFHAFLLFLFYSFFGPNFVSCTSKRLSYSKHCSSVVPEPKPVEEDFNIFPFPARQFGYYNGGDNVLGPSTSHHCCAPKSKTLVFETHHVYVTDAKDVIKVEGNLILQSLYNHERSSSYHESLSFSGGSNDQGLLLDFDLQGFWSRTTGKLCMVGSSYTYSKEGELLHLAAVLKLNNVNDSSTIQTLVTGTMDSLNHAHELNYFDPISLLMFPQASYSYTTKVSSQFFQVFPGGIDVPEKSSLSLSKTITICYMLLGGGNTFELEYASDCDSSKNCNPFGDGNDYLPRFMYLRVLQCSEDKQSLQFMIQFSNDSYMGHYYDSFNFNTSLVGEGTWDSKKHRLCIVACRIYDASSSLEKSLVGDCTARLSLRYPAILSIRNTSTVVGEIWSEKPKNDSTFFERIVFRGESLGYGKRGIQLQGLKYEYTEINKVKKSCLPKKRSSKGQLQYQYPDAYSNGMQFYISAIKLGGLKRSIGWGNSNPLSVGDPHSQRFPLVRPSSNLRPKPKITSPLSISYKISITLLTDVKLDPRLNSFNQSLDGYLRILIFAEGVYDAETGNICMVGCRDLRQRNHLYSNDTRDCEILVDIQFPPLNSDENNGQINGNIKSMRKETDHLYFRPVEFIGRANYAYWASN